MSGVAILGYLMANDQTLVAQVPAEKIIGGIVPLETVLPAIGILSITGIPRNTVAMTGTRLWTERVQVTPMADQSHQGGAYPFVQNVLPLIRRACANRNGSINGFVLDSILPDVEGPHFDDPVTRIVQKSQDFIVRGKETI